MDAEAEIRAEFAKLRELEDQREVLRALAASIKDDPAPADDTASIPIRRD